jgi:nickel-dependent lactate racemase
MPKREAIDLPFADGVIAFQPPGAWRVEVADLPPQESSSPDIPDAVRHPIAGPRLRELARESRSAVVAFTDATRATPDRLLVPPILDDLRQGGLAPQDITLICGVGMHRPSKLGEKCARLGRDVVEGYVVLDHDPSEAIWVGEAMGVPLWVNRRCVETDLLVATGLVEPHQFAGYSGGGKTVAIGCGGSETIRTTHGPRLLDHPCVQVGEIEGNPFQAIVRESARQAGLRFVVNVVLGREESIAHVAAGPPVDVHERLVPLAAALNEVPVRNAPYDVIVVGVGAPKDANLYQASRAATYVDKPSLLSDGGVVIVPAPCPEGPGGGEGERNASESLCGASSASELIERFRREGCRPGEQRAFWLAKLLLRAHVIVVGACDPALVRSWHLLSAESLEEAAQMAQATVGATPNALIVPHALQSLPRPIR